MEKDQTSPDRILQARLRFRGSEALSNAIRDTLIKPHLRNRFAEQALYLYFRTENPIDVSPVYDTASAALYGKDPTEDYGVNLAKPYDRGTMFSHHYPLSSRYIGFSARRYPTAGRNILFDVQANELEKSKLLAPPIGRGAADKRPLLAHHEIPAQWLKQPGDRRTDLLNLCDALGDQQPAAIQSGRLSNSFYVTEPTLILSPVLKRPARYRAQKPDA